ncbi:hypothetical protein [Nocardiopsis sp. NPDC055824]
MSLFAKVVAATGATTADVVRVATEGGTTSADWDIAVAIEKAGGRLASDLMFQPERSWRAEHTRLHDALWEETREEDVEFLAEHAARAGITDITPLLPAVKQTPEAPAPANPKAVYDSEVRIYPESTAPDAPNTIAPHHPHHPGDDDGQVHDDREAAEDLAVAVHDDLAEVLGDEDAATKLTGAWSTPDEGRATLRRVLAIEPRTRRHAAAHHGLDLLTAA